MKLSLHKKQEPDGRAAAYCLSSPLGLSSRLTAQVLVIFTLKPGRRKPAHTQTIHYPFIFLHLGSYRDLKKNPTTTKKTNNTEPKSLQYATA